MKYHSNRDDMLYNLDSETKELLKKTLKKDELSFCDSIPNSISYNSPERTRASPLKDSSSVIFKGTTLSSTKFSNILSNSKITGLKGGSKEIPIINPHDLTHLPGSFLYLDQSNKQLIDYSLANPRPRQIITKEKPSSSLAIGRKKQR